MHEPSDPASLGYWDADNLLRAFGRGAGQIRLSDQPPSDALMGALCNLAAQRAGDVEAYRAGWEKRWREGRTR